MPSTKECPECRGTGQHCNLGECTSVCIVCNGEKVISVEQKTETLPDPVRPGFYTRVLELSTEQPPPERLHADAALGREPGTTAAMEAEERGEVNGVTHTFGPGDKVTHVDNGTSVGTIKSASPEYPAEYLYVEWADTSTGVYPRTKLRRHEEPRPCPKCGMNLLQSVPHRQRECQTISDLRDQLFKSQNIRQTMEADIERYKSEVNTARHGVEFQKGQVEKFKKEASDQAMQHFRELRASQHEARHWKGNHGTLVKVNARLRAALQLITEQPGRDLTPTRQIAHQALNEEANGKAPDGVA